MKENSNLLETLIEYQIYKTNVNCADIEDNTVLVMQTACDFYVNSEGFSRLENIDVHDEVYTYTDHAHVSQYPRE